MGARRTGYVLHAPGSTPAGPRGACGRAARWRLAGLLVLPSLVLQAGTSTSAGAVDAQPGEAPLEAAVTADGTVARDHAWSIEKVADAPLRPVGASGAATFRYTVTARAGAMTETGWAVSGTVTVTNPRHHEDVTADVTVASDLGGGVACTVTGGDDVVVPASGDGAGPVSLPYACTFASAPAASGTVSATVTWGGAGTNASTPVSFAVTSEVNKTVAVVDDKTVPGQRHVLDPALTWAPDLVRTYSYDLAVIGGAPGSCVPYTNTAMLDQPIGPDPTASAAVRACAAEVLPAQAFGRAVGAVKATCHGTVRARMSNRSGEAVVYKLRVGQRLHRITVGSLSQKKFVTRGRALTKVTLKAGPTRLDQIRIPRRCEAPVVLPVTGLRTT